MPGRGSALRHRSWRAVPAALGRTRSRARPRPPRRSTTRRASARAEWSLCGVPRISEFYGIVIAMYYREHGVPHFHATYAGETVVIAIQTGDVIAGNVPA